MNTATTFHATVHYRTQSGGNTWMGDVTATTEEQAFEAAKAAMRKARPSARNCRIDTVNLIPSKA